MVSFQNNETEFLQSKRGVELLSFIQSKQFTSQHVSELLQNSVSESALKYIFHKFGLVNKCNIIQQEKQKLFNVYTKKIYEKFVSSNMHVCEIFHEAQFSITENSVITIPSNKKRLVYRIKALIQDSNSTVIIACSRLIYCNQFVNMFSDAGINVLCAFKDSNIIGAGVVVCTYERINHVLNKLFENNILPKYVIVDEYHTLYEDRSFRSNQNKILISACEMLYTKGSIIHLMSRMLCKNSLKMLHIPFNKHYIFKWNMVVKNITFVPTNDFYSALVIKLKDCVDKGFRVVCIYGEKKRGAELVFTCNNSNLNAQLITNKFKGEINWTKSDIVVTTSVDNFNLSISDNRSTVVIICSMQDTIYSLLRQCSKIKGNIIQFAILVKKYKCFKDEYKFTSSIVNQDVNKLPIGYDYLKIGKNKKVKTWLTSNIDISQQELIHNITTNKILRDVFNKIISMYSFQINVSDMQLSSVPKSIGIDLFSNMINVYIEKEFGLKYIHLEEFEREVCISTSLQALDIFNTNEFHLNLLYSYLHIHYNISYSEVARILESFIFDFKCNSIVSIFEEVLFEISSTMLSCLMPIEERKDFNMPNTLDELLQYSFKERKAIKRRADTVFSFYNLVSHIDLYNLIKSKLTPVQHISCQLALIFFENCKSKLYSVVDIKNFIREFVGFGSPWLGGKLLAANLKPSQYNSVYNMFIELIQTFGKKIKRHTIFYEFTNSSKFRFRERCELRLYLYNKFKDSNMNEGLISSFNGFNRDAVFSTPAFYSIFVREVAKLEKG